MTSNRKKILSEVRNNPNITSAQLSVILGISITAVQKKHRVSKVCWVYRKNRIKQIRVLES